MNAAPSRLVEAPRTGFWAVPAGCVVLALLLALALDEIGQYGSDSQQVQARIDALLTDLLDAALSQHEPALLAQEQRRAGRSAPTSSTSTSGER